MTISIVYSRRAQQHLDALDEYWIAEHGSSPNPLIAELHHAAELLRANPKLGRVIGRSQRREVRVILLRPGWHLHYQFAGRYQRIEIVAVWYAGRGSPPPL